jgi:Peptidase C39 family
MRVWAVALCAAAGFVSPVFAQVSIPVSAPALLAVPYLPQTEALCGGAAAAMVMRYWGARDVYPDIFAPLVDRSAGGIRTSALVDELLRRRWTAVSFEGDASRMSAELARGRPVIALIEDRPGRFHYVVIVSAAAEQVVLHDPARAPSRVVDRRKFDAAWQKSQRWMLVLTPGPDLQFPAETDSAPSVRSSRSDPAPPGPCDGAVTDAVSLAERGDKSAARRALEAAAAACPAAAGPWRELAGLDALDGQWSAAAEHARRAVARDPDDEHAWRVLATAEYLRHDDLAALAAWNRIGEPRIDLIDITGLEHTRYMVVADAIGVRPKAVLTPDALRLAQRRVLAVPAIAAARVSFRPAESGRAQIEASVVERTRAPTNYPSWLGIGLRAATDRELAASVTSVSGGGDVVAASWRWWAHRPMAAVSYAAPGPGGVWRIDASRETQTFGASAFEETRTRAGADISNWIDQRTRVRAGAAIEGWSDRPRTAAVSGRVEFWPIVDRLALEGGGTAWRGRGVSFGGADVAARWRSNSASLGTVWRADAGYRAVTATSPSSIWPGADTGPARDVLLRAHPLVDDGVIRGGVFGRRLTFGAFEVQRWLNSGRQPVRLAPAIFVDIARATRGLATSTDRTQIDAGAGLRVSLFGMGVLRVDLAHGLRDGRNALSVGWQR